MTTINHPISLDVDVIIDPDQAAALLAIPKATLQKYRSTGEHNIPYIKVGRHVRYRTTDLRVWIEKHTKGAA